MESCWFAIREKCKGKIIFKVDGTDSEILPFDILEKDLNSMLKVPSFSASALKGAGVFETLREISKLVVKDVSRKVMLLDKQSR
jgi:hypothetical protein